MAHAKKKVYKDGSFGANRAAKDITLNYIKKVVKATPINHRAKVRNEYRTAGLLGGRV